MQSNKEIFKKEIQSKGISQAFMPYDCTGKCNIITKLIGENNTNFCDECLGIISYSKPVKQQAPKRTQLEKKDQQSHNKLDRKSLKSDVDIKSLYNVKSIASQDTHEWLKYKHYARRVPPIKHAFGIFQNDTGVMIGVCTYGPPARQLNNGKGLFDSQIEIETMELNRLCVDDNVPENTLSYFLSSTLNMLKQPCVIVSYADENNNHHGFIYQATNWLYLGMTQAVKKFMNTRTNKEVHQRTIVSKYGSVANTPDYITQVMEKNGKHRYLMLLAPKKLKQKLKKLLVYNEFPYPKGVNKKYDASHETQKQLSLIF